MLDVVESNVFHILTGDVIGEILGRNHRAIIASVMQTYLAHEAGETTNPDSYFLRFPQDQARRIIALPAALHGENPISGIKWIASYPSNLALGLQRASAVLVLNDARTGYPLALLEGSRISAARTAASAVLGAYWLNRQTRATKRLSIIGAGYIARNIIEMFKADIVIFATNASSPYVARPTIFAPGQIILNISLRDIAPELLLDSQNIFDDVSHCLKADTSPHLAQQLCGHQGFVTGTLAGVMSGKVKINLNTPVIYSPFGMGILDLALGRWILNTALDENSALRVPNFFGDLSRW